MIQVSDLCLRVGRFALHEVTLDVARGDYFALLGPNGSGKTLLLECLCGLIRPSRGRIFIGGRDVTGAAPRHRHIGYVPQDYGLFPHLTVEQNVVFALRARGRSRRNARRAAEPLVEMLGLGRLLPRHVVGLSGGEQQKVALARALALRPRLLLLDEPISAIDPADHHRLCAELRHLQQELGVATIHVTHSVEEALAVSDHAGVLFDGRLVQTAPTAEVVQRPANEAVARLVGVENIIDADAMPEGPDRAVLSFAGRSIRCATSHRGRVRFVVRPDRLGLAPCGSAVTNAVQASLVAVQDCGAYRRLEMDAGVRLVVYTTGAGAEAGLVPGQPYQVVFPPESVHVLDPPIAPSGDSP